MNEKSAKKIADINAVHKAAEEKQTALQEPGEVLDFAEEVKKPTLTGKGDILTKKAPESEPILTKKDVKNGDILTKKPTPSEWLERTNVIKTDKNIMLNDFYKQFGDFWIWKDEPSGKWVKFSKATPEQIRDCIHREIHDREMVLDMEDKAQLPGIEKKLQEMGYNYAVWDTGSRGFHIHMIFNELKEMDVNTRKATRRAFILLYGCDKERKAGLIALEGEFHYKNTGKRKTLVRIVGNGDNKLPELKIEKAEAVSMKEIAKPKTEGNRNESIFRLATGHRQQGAKVEETMLLVKEVNKNNSPPLSDRELEIIVKSAYIKEKPYNVRFKEKPKADIDSDMFFKIVRYTQGDKAGQIKMKSFVPKRLGDFIIEKLPIKTLTGNNEIYYYSDGLYLENGEGKIAELVANHLGEDYKKNHLSEVVSYIKSVTQTDVNELEKNFINLKNGMLNIITGELVEHSSDMFTIRQLPVEYDPKADCPFFKEKLSEKTDPDVMLTFQEMGGYSLLPGQKYERAFMLYGPPRTMKSTALYAISVVLGIDNIKAFSLHNLIEDRFAPAYLFGVMANIAPDISGKELKDTSFFMAWTGGDPITSGKKGKHYITFRPDCKPIFSCNKVPGTRNRSDAFYRRWLMLSFNNQTPKNELITDMKEQIDAELPGVLNWMISGLKRLLKNDDFTLKPSMEEIRDMYEKNSDSVTSFIYNRIEEADSNSITKRDVYKAYTEYCLENELTPENVIYFGKWFRETTGCGTCKKGPGGFSVPAYSGISFKTSRKNNLSSFDSKEEVS